MLSIQEYITNGNLDIAKVYVDKFFINLKDDIDIYLDNDLIKWFGYDGDLFKQKQNIKNIITKNFILNEDYKIMNNKEYKILEIPIYHKRYIGNKTQHILIKPNIFKELAMMINTNKSKNIRRYYIKLEKLLKDLIKVLLYDIYLYIFFINFFIKV